MECNGTNILRALFPYAIEIVHHEGVHAGASSYHNMLRRTRSCSTTSVGTMEHSNTIIRRVLFQYKIVIAQHKRVLAGVGLCHNILGRTRSYNTSSVGAMDCSSKKPIVPLFPLSLIHI